MPVRCSVPGCRSNYRNSKSYVSVYSFPKNLELRNKWVEAIHRENWTPTKFSAVCRLHFNEEDVVSTVSWIDTKANIKITAPLMQTRLTETAIPSQFDEAHYYALNSVKTQLKKRYHPANPPKENDSTAKSKKVQKDEDGVPKKKKRRNYKRKNAVKIIKELQDESIDIVSVALDGAEVETSDLQADDNSEAVSTVAEPFSIVHMDVQNNVNKRESDDESSTLNSSQSTFLVPNDLKISDILKYVNSLKNSTGESGESDNKIVLVIEEPNNSLLYNIQSIVDGENNRKELTEFVTTENGEDEEEQSVVVIVEDQVILNMDEVPSMTAESTVQETVVEEAEDADINELVLVEEPEEQEVTDEQSNKNDESQEVTIDKEISKMFSTTDLMEHPKIKQSNIINFAAFAADITNDSLMADEDEEEVDDVVPMESATGVITDNTQNLILDEINNAEQIADNQVEVKENFEENSESISDVASDGLKNSNDKENMIPNDGVDKENNDYKSVNNNGNKTVRFNVDKDYDSKDDVNNKDCKNFDDLSLKIESDSIPAITAKIVNVLQTVMGGKNANKGNTHIERSPDKNSKDLLISTDDPSSAVNQDQKANNSTLLNEYNNVPLFIMKDVIEEISKICSDHEMKRLSSSTKKSGGKSKTKDKIVFNVTFLNKNGNVNETAVSPENNCLIMSSNSLSNSSLKCTYSFQSPNTQVFNEIGEKQKKKIARKKIKNEKIESSSVNIVDIMKDFVKKPIVKLIPIDNEIIKKYENNEKISARLCERNHIELPTSLNSKRSKRIRRKSTFFNDEFVYFDEQNTKKRRKTTSNYYKNHCNIKGINRITNTNMMVRTISNNRRIINSIIDKRMNNLQNLTNEESRKNETLNYLKLTVNNSSQRGNDKLNNVNDIEEVLRQLNDPVNESENIVNSVDDVEQAMSQLYKEETVTGINQENEQIKQLTTDNEITFKNIEDQLKDLHGEKNNTNNVENVTKGDDEKTIGVNKNSNDKDDTIVRETSVALLYKENVITIKYIDDLQNFTLSNTEEVVITEPDIKDHDIKPVVDENNDVDIKDVDNTEVDNKEEKNKTIYVNELEEGDVLSVNDKKYKIKDIEVNASNDYTHKIVLVDDTVKIEQNASEISEISEISEVEEVIYLKVNCDDVTSISMKGETKLKPPLKKYKCQYCNNSYTRDSLRRHLKRHKGEKICPLCSRSFPNEDIFNIHFEDHKTNKCHERYICFTCGKKFVYLKNFKRHAIVAHKNMNPDDVHKNAVVLIPENENYKRRLKKDVSVEGDDENNRQDRVMCEICGQLTTAAYYKTHLVYHSGERPFRCDVCNKGFCEKAALKTHMRRHTGEKPFVCEICSKAFFCSSSLLKHKRIHDGSWLVQCPLCDKTLSSPYRLKFHLRIHSGEKPFVCEQCGRTFTCKKSYDKHLVMHNLEVDPCEEIINAAWSAATMS